MAHDRSFDDIVLFELPTREFAERLLAHVTSERLAWLQFVDAPLVGVLLNPHRLDLAHLLRCVQAWLERFGLAAIRFEVDGRIYLLEATQPAAVAAG
jgi:hypothetical protein